MMTVERLNPGCFAAAVLALLLAGPAQASGRSCSLAGASFREYRSQHFVIDAAGWQRDPRILVAAFEDLYAAVLASLVAEPVEIPALLRVVVLPRVSDLAEYG